MLGYSQADCIVLYQFTGVLERVEISDSSKVIIKVPHTYNLVGYEAEEIIHSKIEIDAYQNNFKKKFKSHLSSIFCLSVEKIINDFFIGENKSYKFVLISEGSTRKFKLAVNKDNFQAKSDSNFDYIEINIGTLEW